jgi:hypothetical protein
MKLSRARLELELWYLLFTIPDHRLVFLPGISEFEGSMNKDNFALIDWTDSSLLKENYFRCFKPLSSIGVSLVEPIFFFFYYCR